MGNGTTGYGSMNIFYSNPTTLRIEFPAYDATTTTELMRRLNTVPGIEGRGRRYYAPMIQLARLMELFWRASFDYRAMAAADLVARIFYTSSVRMGIEFAIDASGAVCALGENVSPVVEQLVADRSHALKPLLIEAQALPKQEPVRRELQAVASVVYPKRKAGTRKRRGKA